MGKGEAPFAVEQTGLVGGRGAEGGFNNSQGCSILSEGARVGFNKCSYNVTSNLLLNFKKERKQQSLIKTFKCLILVMANG